MEIGELAQQHHQADVPERPRYREQHVAQHAAARVAALEREVPVEPQQHAEHHRHGERRRDLPDRRHPARQIEADLFEIDPHDVDLGDEVDREQQRDQADLVGAFVPQIPFQRHARRLPVRPPGPPLGPRPAQIIFMTP